MPNKKGMVVCVDKGEGAYLVENEGGLIHVACNMFDGVMKLQCTLTNCNIMSGPAKREIK